MSENPQTTQAEPTSGDVSAHQVDGQDSSASFAAGIADEGTIPGTMPAGAATMSVDPAAQGSAGAHQADGTDSSASFKAGIADEGTIPEQLPGGSDNS